MCSKRTFTTYGLGGYFDLSAPRFLGGDNGAHLQVVVRVEPRCDVSEPSGTRRAAGVRQLVPARQAGRGEAVGCRLSLAVPRGEGSTDGNDRWQQWEGSGLAGPRGPERKGSRASGSWPSTRNVLRVSFWQEASASHSCSPTHSLEF